MLSAATSLSPFFPSRSPRPCRIRPLTLPSPPQGRGICMLSAATSLSPFFPSRSPRPCRIRPLTLPSPPQGRGICMLSAATSLSPFFPSRSPRPCRIRPLTLPSPPQRRGICMLSAAASHRSPERVQYLPGSRRPSNISFLPRRPSKTSPLPPGPSNTSPLLRRPSNISPLPPGGVGGGHLEVTEELKRKPIHFNESNDRRQHAIGPFVVDFGCMGKNMEDTCSPRN